MDKKFKPTSTIRAVLFDLDGTLLDTAKDLAFALNTLRKSQGLPELLMNAIKPFISHGSKKLLKVFLEAEETDPNYARLREQLFHLYAQHCHENTLPFMGIEQVLQHLHFKNIVWGIVTNRITSHTDLLMQTLTFDHLPKCIVCADTVQKAKPDPDSILHACTLLNLTPSECVYIGDAATDVQAAKAAGMKSLVALYGYIGKDEDPRLWQADGYIDQPADIIEWIQSENASRQI